MNIDELIKNLNGDSEKTTDKRNALIDSVAKYLYEVCDNPINSSQQVIEYIRNQIINGHHYQDHVMFEKAIREYHQSRTDLEASAEKLIDIVDDYDKWRIE